MDSTLVRWLTLRYPRNKHACWEGFQLCSGPVHLQKDIYQMRRSSSPHPSTKLREASSSEPLPPEQPRMAIPLSCWRRRYDDNTHVPCILSRGRPENQTIGLRHHQPKKKKKKPASSTESSHGTSRTSTAGKAPTTETNPFPVLGKKAPSPSSNPLGVKGRSIRGRKLLRKASEARVNRRRRRYYLIVLLLPNTPTLACLPLSSK